MTMRASALVCAAMAFGMPTDAAAQRRDVEWRQVLNTPRGANLPAGVQADILGIQIGEPYADAMAKLARIRSEPANSGPQPQIGTRQIGLRTLPNNETLIAEHPENVILVRKMRGAGARPYDDVLNIRFSAPSSGHQVVSITRSIRYQDSPDEPKISEFLAQIKAKYGGELRTLTGSDNAVRYLRIQYDNGRVVAGQDLLSACMDQTSVGHAASIPSINASGDCDVVLNIQIDAGISPDHARAIVMTLSDNERAKANVTADLEFFRTYVEELMQRLQSQNRAPSPRL